MKDRPSPESKTTLVTGGAKEIGPEISRSLAADGANVIFHYRLSPNEADQLCQELKDPDVRVWALSADFEKPKEHESLLDPAQGVAGRVDALVNNADSEGESARCWC